MPDLHVSAFQLEEEHDIIDELTLLADQSNSSVAIISDDFEEGSQLYSAFGGIAAFSDIGPDSDVYYHS